MLGSQSERAKQRLIRHSIDMTLIFLPYKHDRHWYCLKRKRENLTVLPQMRCNDHVFTVLGAGNNWGGLPSPGRDSQPLKETRPPYGSTLEICIFLLIKKGTCVVRTLEHYGKSKKSAVFARFLECGLWCSARLSCTLSARSSLQQDRLWAGRNRRDGSNRGGQRLETKHGHGVT